MDAELRDRILALGDVDLVRLLTVQSAGESPEALALATDEAKRRGVPIDEGFIPRGGDAEVGGVRSDRLRWIAGGVELVCPHCGGDRFGARGVLLNTRVLTFLELDWLDRGAQAMECSACGLVQLFARPPQSLPD